MDKRSIRILIVLGLFAVCTASVRLAERYRSSHARSPNWEAISSNFDGWEGADAQFDPVYGVDPAQGYLLRLFRKDHRPPVIAYVGFYGNVATILEAHTPDRCYPGQGWTVLSTRAAYGGYFRGKVISGQEMIVAKDGEQRLVMWWYNAGSRPFKTRIRYVYAMLMLSTITGRTDGSLVRIETPFGSDGAKGASERLDDFRRSFLQELDRALPN